jgi:hypothetical protein
MSRLALMQIICMAWITELTRPGYRREASPALMQIVSWMANRVDASPGATDTSRVALMKTINGFDVQRFIFSQHALHVAPEARHVCRY